MNQRSATQVAGASRLGIAAALAVLSSETFAGISSSSIQAADKTTTASDGIGMKKSLGGQVDLQGVVLGEQTREIKTLGKEAAGIKVAPMVDLGEFGIGARRASSIGHSREIKNAAAWPGHAQRRNQAGQIARA